MEEVVELTSLEGIGLIISSNDIVVDAKSEGIPFENLHCCYKNLDVIY